MTTWTWKKAHERVAYYVETHGNTWPTAIHRVAYEADLNAAQTADLIRVFKAQMSLGALLDLHALRATSVGFVDGATEADGWAAETALAHCAIHYAAGLRSDQPANILPPLPALTSRTKASLITTATRHRENMLAATNDDMPLHVWARHWQISSHYMENLAR